MNKRRFKQILSCMLVLILILGTVFVLNISAANSEIAEVSKTGTTTEGLGYVILDGEVEITGYLGETAELAIPSTIEGLPVTSIDSYAFSDCTSLESITIPSSVTSIGYYAFNGCISLYSITIPESVVGIDYGAFVDTAYYENPDNWQDGVLYIDSALIEAKNSLSGDYTIKTGTTVIADDAFLYCDSLENVTIPEGVISIGAGAFGRCVSLENITIPEGVTSIGHNAFHWCYSLTSVTIPSSVTNIATGAFYERASLESIIVDEDNPVYDSRDNCNAIIETATNTLMVGCNNTVIPTSVTSIDNDAFTNCTSLESVTIPQGVISIGGVAFDGCRSLANIAVDEDNPVYDSRDNCNAIIETATNMLLTGCKNTVIPSGVTSIGYYAFFNCTSLESITIPESVTSIYSYAFLDCRSLKNITISGSVTSIGSGVIDGTAYYENPDNWQDGVLYIDSALIEAEGSLSGDYTIKSGTTAIADNAFPGCDSLESITIPQGLIRIGEDAFWGCSSLTDVYYSGTQEQWKKISIDTRGNFYLQEATIHFQNNPDTQPDPIEPVTTVPSTTSDVIDPTEPVTTVPSTTSDITDPTESVTSEPITTEPATTLPAETKPGTSEPTESIPTEPESSTFTEPEATYLSGDANGDGKINVKDATHIQKSAASLVTLDDVQVLASDANGDGKVNVKDATAIQKFVADIPVNFPIGEERKK